MRYLLFYCFIITLFSCRSKEQSSENPFSSQAIQETDFSDYLTLTTTFEELRIRNEAGFEGKEIGRLTKGDKLYYLGESSDFTTPFVLNEKAYNTPWLKVVLSDGKEGWAYAGGVSFDKVKGKALAKELVVKQLYNYFGSALGEEVNTYIKSYEAVELAAEFPQLFSQALILRDKLCTVTKEKGSSEKPPSLLWEENGINGLIPALNQEKDYYYLFMDYRDWQKLAAKTKGMEDDEFIKFYFTVFEDGIEFYTGNWQWEVDGEIHSLLGEGHHAAIFGELSKSGAETKKLFEQQIIVEKSKILKDIIRSGSYWLAKEKIVAELEEITNFPEKYTILEEEELQLIKERLQQFEQPETYQIRLNVREGE